MELLLDEPNVHLALTSRGIFHVQLKEVGVDQRVNGGARPDFERITDQIQAHLEAHAPVHYLVGFFGMRDMTMAERWRLARRMRKNRPLIVRSAVYGLSRSLEFVFGVVTRISGRDNLRAFHTMEGAEAWLLTLKRADASQEEAMHQPRR